MTTNTKAGTNGKAGDFTGPEIAEILADPTDSRLDALHEWMDAAKEELGVEDARAARHDELFDAAITGLAGLVRISPQDEMERMIAAQLVAAHVATMDCYRRSRTSDADARRENLNQANKLSRAFVMLFGALQRNRGRVQQRAAAPDAPSGGYSPSRPEAGAKLAAHGASGTSETAADEKSEKQPHAKRTAPPLAPVRPSAPPVKAASVSAPAVGQVASLATPAAESAKIEEQPHAKPMSAVPGPGTSQRGSSG